MDFPVFTLFLISLVIRICASCDCGLEGFRSRIYNGRIAQSNKYPWMAHIRFTQPRSTSYTQCGGSLIDSQHILTAAHCIFDSSGNLHKPSNTQIYLGIQDKVRDYKTPLAVSEFIYDIRYTPQEPMDYDIAILRLKQPVRFSSTVSPICVPASDLNSYTKFTVAGWGNTNSQGGSSEVLREVEVGFIPKTRCNKMKYEYIAKKNNLPSYFRFNVVPVHTNHICALNEATGGDACAGDSGGPLMYKNPKNGRWYIIGIVSGAWDHCGVDRGVPGLYTSVSAYRSTIKSAASDACILSF